MPITESAKKALRQTVRRHERNLKKKNDLRAVIKKYKKLVAAKDTAGAEKELQMVYKKLDKSAKTNVIKKNKASRLKSRLSRLLVAGNK